MENYYQKYIHLKDEYIKIMKKIYIKDRYFQLRPNQSFFDIFTALRVHVCIMNQNYCVSESPFPKIDYKKILLTEDWVTALQFALFCIIEVRNSPEYLENFLNHDIKTQMEQ